MRPRLAVFRSRMHMQLPLSERLSVWRSCKLFGYLWHFSEIWMSPPVSEIQTCNILRYQRHALVVDDTVGTGLTMVHVLPLVQPFMPTKRESGQCAQRSFTSKVTSKQAGSLEKIRSKQGSNLSCACVKQGQSMPDGASQSQSGLAMHKSFVSGPRGCEKGDEKTWSTEAAEIVSSVQFCWSYALWNCLPAVRLYIEPSAADR